jgi:hypothetical protein
MTTGTTGQAIQQTESTSVDRRAVRTMIRALVMAGCTPTEAANLAGLAVGLRPVASGWRPQEIEALRFLRHLVAGGQLPA